MAVRGVPAILEEPPCPDDQSGAAVSLVDVFRRLYYHLYANSTASRAERIMEDLALLLLLKLARERDGSRHDVFAGVCRQGQANERLLPAIRAAFPGLVDSQQRFSLDDGSLRTAWRDLHAIRLSAAPAHVLGEAFQALIGPRLRGDKGQFFTPRSLVRAMVEVIAPGPDERILDPACGTGGFLVEAHAYRQGRAGSARASGALVGIDKDRDLTRLALALAQIAAPDRIAITHLNALDPVAWDAHLAGMQFDVILTNPPFGARIGIREPEILKHYDLAHHWVPSRGGPWRMSPTVAGSQDPQTLFLELCVRRLKPGGRLGIVLPEGVFGNRRQGYVWDWLRGQGRITALLDCPRTTFQPGTDTKTNVLFFEKHLAPSPGRRDPHPEARVAVALHCGHDRRGRVRSGDGRAHPDDFARLGPAFHTSGEGWRDVVLSQPDYLVPRYYLQQEQMPAQEAALTRGAPVCSLGDLVARAIVGIRKGHEVGSAAYGTGEIPFVRTSDLANFEISSDPTTAVGEEVYAAYAPLQRLRPGDILMVVDGRYRIGATALLTPHNCRCLIQSHLRAITVLDSAAVAPHELLFALNLPSVRLHIRNLVFVQSTLGTLGGRLLELRIPILHGRGPWEAPVRRFGRQLSTRDLLLGELKGMGQPDVDL